MLSKMYTGHNKRNYFVNGLRHICMIKASSYWPVISAEMFNDVSILSCIPSLDTVLRKLSLTCMKGSNIFQHIYDFLWHNSQE